MPALQRVEMKSRKGRLTYGVIMTILCVGIPMQVFPYIWILLSMFRAPTRKSAPFRRLSFRINGFGKTYRRPSPSIIWNRTYSIPFCCASALY